MIGQARNVSPRSARRDLQQHPQPHGRCLCPGFRLCGGWEHYSSGTTYEEGDTWYRKRNYKSGLGSVVGTDITEHIKERKSTKTGAGATDPHDTHTLHRWGEQATDNPNHSVPSAAEFPSGGGYGNEIWIEDADDEDDLEGRTYFDDEGEYGNLKTWDLHWNNGSVEPVAQPKADGTGPARGTGSIPGGVAGGGMSHQEMMDLINREALAGSLDDLSAALAAEQSRRDNSLANLPVTLLPWDDSDIPSLTESLDAVANDESVQFGLDSAGFAEGPVGMGADLTAAALAAKRGDWSGAELGMLSAIPAIGVIFNYIKAGRRAENVVGAVADGAKHVDMPGTVVTKMAKLSEEASNTLRAEARKIWHKATGRAAAWDDLQVHHRVPLEWAHLFPDANPNRLENLLGVDPNVHAEISNAWAAWKRSLNGRTPSQAEILGQASMIDEMFKGAWVYPNPQ